MLLMAICLQSHFIMPIFTKEFFLSNFCPTLPNNNNNTVLQDKKSCLSQKGDLPSVVVEDIPSNPTSAQFPYHIRIVGFLALKFQTLTISVLFFHLSLF